MSNIEIIREVRRPNGHTHTTRCVLRTNCYGSDMEFLSMLATHAREDFPDLSDKEIEVTQYAGDHYARHFGIEFNIENAFDVPSHYVEIDALALTF